jgi:hypothetical protein
MCYYTFSASIAKQTPPATESCYIIMAVAAYHLQNEKIRAAMARCATDLLALHKNSDAAAVAQLRQSIEKQFIAIHADMQILQQKVTEAVPQFPTQYGLISMYLQHSVYEKELQNKIRIYDNWAAKYIEIAASPEPQIPATSRWAKLCCWRRQRPN